METTLMSSLSNYRIYADGACSGNPGPGAFCALIIFPEGDEAFIAGKESNTTNNRMEVKAAIAGLDMLPSGVDVEVISDSLYLINTMRGHYRRMANKDLWDELDPIVTRMKSISWTWIRGHNGNEGNERVNRFVQGLLKERS